MNKERVLSLNRKDFKLEFFRSGGNGGQNVNKVSSACRITHIESGAVGESREERDQYANRKKAFKRLSEHPKFKVWLAQKLHELDTHETAEQWMERQMDSKNLKVEVLTEEQRWVEEEE